MNDIFQIFRNLGPPKMAALGVVTIGLLGFFIYLATSLSTPNMALLYGELNANDSAVIVTKLQSLGVPYDSNLNGSEILVPANDVGRLRMIIASEGLPTGGSVGYELFNDMDNFGTTNFLQNLNHVRALEGELARTISTLTPIQTSRVHLVLPKRELFNKQDQKATASVFIKIKPGVTLSKQQITAIQHLVSTAVPQLMPRQISIIDDKGNLLARGGTDSETDDYLLTEAKDQKLAIETRLTDTIENLLSRSLGYGKVRAEVNADVNFDRVTLNTEKYDPDGQVVRSTQTVEEDTQNQTKEQNDASTVGNNLPAGAAGAGAGNSSNEKTTRTQETVNYEITKTVTNKIQEIGHLNKLSVAVLVDGVYQTDASGTKTYAPRSKEEMDKIETLVKSAIGFDAKRGDVVEVINMQFSTETDLPNTAPEDTSLMGVLKQNMVRISEIGILGVVAILVILLIVRPMIVRLLKRPAGYDANQLAYANSNENQQLANAQAALTGSTEARLTPPGEAMDEKIEQMMDLNQVEGRVRASTIKKVGEIVKKHPDEAVNIIRGWMNQDA
jgi:flagellar M-ring protein FliF